MSNGIAAEEERLGSRYKILRLGLVQLVHILAGYLRYVGPDIFDGERIRIKKLILISLNIEIRNSNLTLQHFGSP